MNYKEKIEEIKVPEVIYLQLFNPVGEPYDENGDDRTWCEDEIHSTDVKYVRADLYEQAQRDAVEGFVSWWEKQELGTSIHHNNVEEYLNQTKEDIKEKQ